MKKQNLLLVGFIVAALAVVAGGLSYGEYRKAQEHKRIEQEQKEKEEQERQEKIEALKKQYDEIFTAFLDRVAEHMNIYKSRRKVLTEMVKTENLREPGYITENYNMAQSLVPELRQDMDEVMAVFEATEQQINALITTTPEGMAADVQAKWQKLESNQIQKYIDFFSFEQTLLDHYLELMKFYDSRKEVMEADVENQRLIFLNEEDQETENLILTEIHKITVKQAALFSNQ